MKKLTCALAALVIIFSLAACGNNTQAETPALSTQHVSSNTENGSSAETADEPLNATPDINTDTAQTGDVDLTALSSTMVYAEVYNMMYAPEDYVGRTVKMAGQFDVYEDTANNLIYFACVIADATACCQQGIEFVLADESIAYPEDYPELGATIIVTGEFQTYEENGYLYCRLIDAEMLEE